MRFKHTNRFAGEENKDCISMGNFVPYVRIYAQQSALCTRCRYDVNLSPVEELSALTIGVIFYSFPTSCCCEVLSQ